jgi:hypothetical protein
VRRLGDGLGRLAARLGAARLVAHRDEQGGDVLTVLPRLGEGGARTIRLNALGRQIDTDGVGVAVRPFDATLCARFGDLHVLDYAPTRVVEAAQKCPRPEQTSESAITER